eukprot:PhF_6_TR25126/c0_g1_i1/m.34565/K08876/SCYL1; SCY1-like protein 1
MIQKNSTSSEMARNALQRARTVRLPHVLKVYRATEHQGVVYIATESCSPLAQSFNNGEMTDDVCAFGLQRIATTLSQLHSSGLVHGNVCVNSVYVTNGGEFKLFGLDLCTKNDGDHLPLWQSHASRIDSCCHRTDRKDITPEGADALGFAALIYEVYGPKKHDTVSISAMKTERRIPNGLLNLYNRLLSPRPASMDEASQDVFFAGIPLVSCLNDLDQLSLLDSTKQNTLYRTLSQHVDTFPKALCRCTILPKLCSALQLGVAGFGALELIVRVGSVLEKQEYSSIVGPALAAMYNNNSDISIRYRLLECAHLYVTRLDPLIMERSIWPPYATGFSHKLPDVREMTIKALVHFAPVLSQKLATDAVRFLQLAQQDQECGIRTNACICMSRIAQYTPQEGRSRALLVTFTKAMKDPFPPCRAAGVASLAATRCYLEVTDVANHAVGPVGAICVDPEPQVRETALKTLQELYTMLLDNDVSLRASANAKSEEQTTTTTTATQEVKKGTPEPQQGGQGWGSWAWKKVAGGATPVKPAEEVSNKEPLTPLKEEIQNADEPPKVARPAQEESAPTISHPAQEKAGWDDGWGDDDDKPIVKKTVKKGLGGAKKLE